MGKQTFTISQALRKIKKVKGELAKQQERVSQSVMYDQEEEPAFTYKDSVTARDNARINLIELSAGVAETNAKTYIKFGDKEISVAKALRILAELKTQIGEYKTIGGISMRLLELQKSRETVRKNVVQKFEDVNDKDGNYTGQRHVEVEVENTIICNLTVSERAEAIEKLEAEFESLNNEVETANHTTSFEVSLL